MIGACSWNSNSQAVTPTHTIIVHTEAEQKHTHTHTHIHTNTHTRTHARARAHSHKHARTLVRTHTYSDTHTRTRARTHVHTQTCNTSIQTRLYFTANKYRDTFLLLGPLLLSRHKRSGVERTMYQPNCVQLKCHLISDNRQLASTVFTPPKQVA